MRCVTAPECFGAICSLAKTSAVLRKQETFFFFLHKPGSEFQGQTVRICMNTIRKQIGTVSICYGSKYAFVVANRHCEYLLR